MRERQPHYDLLRILAILCVIYNHTNERGYYLYAFPSSLILHDFYIAFAALIAVAVPIFFMISGALLLPKQESLKELYQRRVSRILIIILLFSVLQYGVKLWEGTAPLSVNYLLVHILGDSMIPPYWYLYTYLAYLLILPFLRKLVNAMEKRDYHYLFVLLLVVEGLLPVGLYFLGISSVNSFFVLPMLNRIVVYPLLGYYMEYVMEPERYCIETTKVVLVSTIIVLLIFVFMTNLRGLTYDEFTTYDKGLYTCSLTAVLDFGVYYLVKRFCQKRDLSGYRKVLTSLGGATFGIYLIEQPIREHIPAVCDRLAPYLGAFPACIVYVFVVFMVSYVIILLGKQIPGLKKLL